MDKRNISELHPKQVWNIFERLNEIPRPSKHEEKVIEFIRKFGEHHGLPTFVDDAGNVLIQKQASPGLENAPVVCLQGHLDMVHQKNADTVFNFAEEGIRMYVDGDYVKADGTTLGADNGIGVSMILALLESEVLHPPIHALFTINEEAGMSGAKALASDWLSEAKYLINLDTEEEENIVIGSAGGVVIEFTGNYQEEPLEPNRKYKTFRLQVTGLTGGHSGMDIIHGRANAHKIMARLLQDLNGKIDLRISDIYNSLDQQAHNAIPRESFATVTLVSERVGVFRELLSETEATIMEEFKRTDPEFRLVVQQVEDPQLVFPRLFQQNILRSLNDCLHGIYKMDPNIPGLVRTSNNLGVLSVRNGHYTIRCFTRSAIDEEKNTCASKVVSAMDAIRPEITYLNDYPGWLESVDSPLTRLVMTAYQQVFGWSPNLRTIHAGLECGLLKNKAPEIGIISFGPNIMGAHSPQERVEIDSVGRIWNLLLKILTNISTE